MQPLLLCIKDAAGARHSIAAHGCGLDLAQLYAMPHVLDLKILAAYVIELPRRIAACKVACAIDALIPAGVQWILGESLRRAGRVGVVAKRQRRAGDTQLPCLAGLGDKAVVFVQ